MTQILATAVFQHDTLGDIALVVLDNRFVALDFLDQPQEKDDTFARSRPRVHTILTRRFGTYRCDFQADNSAITESLQNYFAGKLFTEIPGLSLGGTTFQQEVWQQLLALKAGTTTTYAALAAQMGNPKAVRAVGTAVGANPVSILVPCHRVIGADGRLTGYAGGLDRKHWLLQHEGVTLA